MENEVYQNTDISYHEDHEDARCPKRKILSESLDEDARCDIKRKASPSKTSSDDSYSKQNPTQHTDCKSFWFEIFNSYCILSFIKTNNINSIFNLFDIDIDLISDVELKIFYIKINKSLKFYYDDKKTLFHLCRWRW